MYVVLTFATLIALNYSVDMSGKVCCGGNANVTVRLGHQICCMIKVCSIYLYFNKFFMDLKSLDIKVSPLSHVSI
jgi:hypothetical protein